MLLASYSYGAAMSIVGVGIVASGIAILLILKKPVEERA
ncbi:hypothetical protein JCM19233_6257 [Vibrio astriarenae]|nr:hypothetical protein JCM19233_6257 [Vibrio sp. C7]